MRGRNLCARGHVKIHRPQTMPPCRKRYCIPHQWLAGCNIAFDKEALSAVGGFSRALGRIGSGLSLLSNDETDVMEKVRATGRACMYCPEAVVEHVIDPT